MKLLDKWMCSSLHLKLFGFVARVGLVVWFVGFTGGVMWLWARWSIWQAYSHDDFLFQTAVFKMLLLSVLLTGYRRKARSDSLMSIQVEARPGLLGLHIGKQVPLRDDLRATVLHAVEIAQQYKMRGIRVESPLLVENRRRALLVSGLKQALSSTGHSQVSIQIIAPKRMLWLRSAMFTAARLLRGYNNKHLPPVSLFKTSTAGVLLVL